MRAAKACSVATCSELQPCPAHQPKPWQGSRRRERVASGSRQQKRRRYVLMRDENRCHVCGEQFLDQQLVADHIIPVSEGGEDDVENMAPCCITCHDRKTQAEAQRGRA